MPEVKLGSWVVRGNVASIVTLVKTKTLAKKLSKNKGKKLGTGGASPSRWENR